MSARTGSFAALVAVALATSPVVRAAEPNVHQAARVAYDRGVEAHRRGDYASAASELARADELEPNVVALEAALQAALLADDPLIGVALVARVDARFAAEAAPASLAAVCRDARERFRGRTARLLVRCAACTAKLDGAPLATGAEIIVRAGPHRLVTEGADGAREVRDLALVADQPTELEVTSVDLASAQKLASNGRTTLDAASRADGRALAPGWAIAGGVLTAALGGATLASGLDVRGRHDDFVARGCSAIGGSGCAEDASAGQRAEVRTDVLLGATAVSLVLTGVAVWLATSSEEGTP